MRRLIALTLYVSVTGQIGCGLEEIESIIGKYDTFGSTGSSGGTSTTGEGTDTRSSETAEHTSSTDPGDTSTEEGTGDTTDSSDTEGASTTEASTGAPSPICGDGIKQGDEECDDANGIEADGCLSNCTREWFVFITSGLGTQGDIKGLVGADYQCRHRAAKMFLPNGERYMAWVSTSEVQPVDRLYHARGPYKLVNGLRVAANWDALIAGPLENPINVTEMSETQNAPVFTGTFSDGTRALDSTHCDDWTDNDGDNFAWFGDCSAIGPDWTFGAEGECGTGGALYCFEQP